MFHEKNITMINKPAKSRPTSDIPIKLSMVILSTGRMV